MRTVNIAGKKFEVPEWFYAQRIRRNSTIEALMRQNPALFHQFRQDPRFDTLMWAIEAATITLQDEEALLSTQLRSAKKAGRAIAPYMQENFELQNEIAALRARDTRPVGQRPRLVFEDAPRDEKTRTFREVIERTSALLNRESKFFIRPMELKAMAEDMAISEEKSNRKGEPIGFITAVHMAGYPSPWDFVFRPRAAAERVKTCAAMAEALNVQWTEAKDTCRDNIRIRKLEEKVEVIEDLLRFVSPYQQEMDELARSARLKHVREQSREKASRSRDAKSNVTGNGHSSVIDFAEAWSRKRDARRGHGRER